MDSTDNIFASTLPTDFDKALSTQLFEASSDGIIIMNPNTEILYANEAIETVFYYTASSLVGKPIAELMTNEDRSKFIEFKTHYINSATDQPIQKQEYTGIKLGGFEFPLSLTLTTTQLGKARYLVLFAHDLSVTPEKLSILRESARKDNLTGLANRSMCLQFLSNKIEDAQKNHYNFATFLLDVDQFYKFNDEYGQPVGDEILQHIAKKIVAACREQDFYARVGANRFVIVMDKQNTLQESYFIGKRLCKIIGRPFTLHEHTITTKVSIGVVTYPCGTELPEKLLLFANQALTHSQCLGGDQVTVYTKAFQQELEIHEKMAKTMQSLSSYEEFAIYYKPQIKVDSKVVFGLQASIRWHSPLLGVQPMNHFIPLAQNVNIISEIGDWAQQNTIRQLCQWYDRDVTIPISLDLYNQKIIHPEIKEKLNRLLLQYPTFKRRMYLELSAMFMSAHSKDENQAQREIDHRLGIRLTLEDFSDDQTSLLYLITQHPFDKITLDRSFIENIDNNPLIRKLIRLIIELTEVRHITTVIEGVETEKELKILQEENCKVFSGPFFYESMPAEEVILLLLTEQGSGLQEF